MEQIVGVPVPRIREEGGEVIQPILQERVSYRVIEQRESNVKVGEVIPQECLQRHTEQIAGVPTDNQPGVQIEVFKDERAAMKDNGLLSKFHVDGIPSAPRGAPQIDVS